MVTTKTTKNLICLVLLLCLTFAAVVSLSGSAQAAANFQTSAQSAVVMEKSSGRILWQKNADAQLPMASTTKIVTALTVIEREPDLDKSVEIPAEACGIEGSSVYLRVGERLTVRELLLGLMLRSGNDCAVALALNTGGTVENFCKMMNETAENVGCENSNFANPHGLPDDNHYTTAKDLARITCNALKNRDFAEIVATKSAKISNDGYDYLRVLTNKNKLLFNCEGADGVKTGYTKKAGRCFVGSATRNGMQVVVVVLNCGPMFEDTASLLDAAFAEYELKCVVPQNKLCGVVYRHGKPTYYYCEDPFYYPLAEGEKATTRVYVEENEQKIEVDVNGATVFTRKLIPVE
ncbi:MAG: D-alanyl-D-alanine carboxypeptidase [Corallococcus sp.]|nr:D-alanyl-D-alanine carboxypeptidase [Corallococcus sp.]MCM1359687.1 D-alanyl-D-alanine carboxypeptidase [Corallococcus sp.]MCM1395396.1 D-alanyl-D-alanine carboxypeptidase [Corallococcus sp.]